MNFFNPENSLWRFLGKLADLFILSGCWLLCSLPLVTIGSASIALYDAVAHGLRRDEGDTYRRFFRTFRAELKRGICLTLLWAAIGLILSFGYQILYQLGGTNPGLATVTVVYYFLLAIPVAMVCWMIAVESRYVYAIPALLRTSAILTFGKLPTSLAVTALLLVGFELCVQIPFLLMILPATVSYFQSWFVERIFTQLTPSDTNE